MAMNPDRKRHFAVQRALKLNVLFKEQYYDDIMDAINMPANTDAQKTARKAAFDAACPAAPGMTQEEKDWLWNYLQHCDRAMWSNPIVRDAAAVGW